MPLWVIDRVLALAKRLVVRCVDNPRAESLRVFEVTVDVLDVHHHVLVNLAGTRRAVLAGLTPQHDGALGHDKLSVANDAPAFGSKALRKSESAAEKFDRFADVLIDQEWNHC